MARLATNRRAALALLGLTALLGILTVEHTVGFGRPGVDAFLLDYAYNALLIGAALVCAARSLVRGRERVAWLLVGLGLLCWSLGDVYWTVALSDLESPPFPSFADALWLAVYPPFYVGIVLLLRCRLAEFPRSLWLDGAIGALAVGAVGSAIVFDTVLGVTEGSPMAVATNLAYPLADLLLVALVVWSLSLTGWRPGRSWALIAAGIAVFAVADALYLYQIAVGSYAEGGVLDLGWLAGAALIAWAAWQPSRARAAAHVDRVLLVVPPVVFGLVGVGVVVYDHFVRVNVLALGLASAALVAVIARLGLTFAENTSMLRTSRREARTDALTHLGNRRRLLDDLQARLHAEERFALALFDLDGFKQYNDTFGHPAGDALLVRLAHNLAGFVEGRGHGYRMGGDEFCVLLDEGAESFQALAHGATEALSEHGDGFRIGSSYGFVVVPDEAARPDSALRLADQRMYAQKHGGRVSAGEQSSNVLLQALVARNPDLGEHLQDVATLAVDVARELGLRADEVESVRIAAALHDVGKMAVPDAILNKPGRLDDAEWQFIRRHTLVGEKILHAAPALGNVAGLVRSSHERWDGTGYPDALAGADIPLGSRIIFVCDAYDAMTSQRPYSRPLTSAQALAELRACAGTQFDPNVVEAFARALRAGVVQAA